MRLRENIIIAAFTMGILFFSKTTLASSMWLYDADLYFIDAHETTGYYIDLNSLKINSPNEAMARFAIIRADENKLYLYKTKFNRKEESYQILHSVIMNYDTKEELSVRTLPFSPIKYMKDSPMYNIVEFIYNPKIE